jgi:hypothetical protein
LLSPRPFVFLFRDHNSRIRSQAGKKRYFPHIHISPPFWRQFDPRFWRGDGRLVRVRWKAHAQFSVCYLILTLMCAWYCFLQLKREISTMKLIRHPNVIRMHEVMHIQYISRIFSFDMYWPVNEIQYILAPTK